MDGRITHAHVERVAPDELLVTWRGPTDVAVFVSDSPDDAGTNIIELAGPRMASVAGLSPNDRPFIHLLAPGGPFVVVAERQIPLDGLYNLRDIGGYAVASGGYVRWGSVFRSDHLADLTDDDLAVLQALGVRTIIDLRGPHELAAQPSPVPADGPITVVNLPIGDGSVDGVPLRELMERGRLDQFTVEDMALLYETMLEEHADVFVAIVMAAAKADLGDNRGEAPTAEVGGSVYDGALLYHCTAGKDRTGLATALLLSVLGVDDATVLDDFELTNRYRSKWRVEELRPLLAEQGLDIDAFMPLFTAPRKSLVAALAGLRERHGSVEGYLVEHGRMNPAVLDQLRARLIVGGPGGPA
jgi:protein-tyrosine phosphatase